MQVIILNSLTFVISYIVAKIAVGIVCNLLDIVAKLPILHQVNELAGLFVGLAEGLLNVWIVFIGLNIFCETTWGQLFLGMINKNSFLVALYNNNLIYMILDLF